MSRVRLATDEDREGEAIARHICQALDLDVDETPRIVFHEITQDAIQQAIANPKRLDLDLVDAQQARRVLDRLVGFELSPVLRKKVKPSLSAGRVQSVAVRILVEREREILSFDPKQTYKVSSQFLTSSDESLEAELSDSIQEAKEVESFLQHCSEANFEVDTVTQNPGKKNPRAPFTTSTLQQAASQKL
jgi:DNA topoisomerase-1